MNIKITIDLEPGDDADAFVKYLAELIKAAEATGFRVERNGNVLTLT